MSTSAAWNDSEWVNAELGTVNCDSPEGAFATRGEGRVLSGSLLGIDLDTVAAAKGVTVTNDGVNAHFSPIGSNPVVDPPSSTADNPTAWSNPLNVTALNDALNVNLGSGLLQLPVGAQLGAVGQFAQAEANSNSKGAAGYITSTGGIGLEPENGYPELASLSLSKILNTLEINQELTALLSNVTDLSLNVGAVTGRATLDGCDAHWNGVTPYVAATDTEPESGNLNREYLATHLDAEIESPLVGSLVSAVSDLTTTLNDTVRGLTGEPNSLGGALLGAINNLLNLGVLGSVEVNYFKATIDLDLVSALLDDTIYDEEGLVSISLSTGVIRVNTVALLAQAYQNEYSNGLNGLAPNSELLINEDALLLLTDAVENALNGWLNKVETELQTAINNIRVELKITVNIIPIARITATIDAKLSELEGTNQTGIVDLDTKILGLDLDGVLNPILNLLTNSLGPTVAGVVRGALPVVTGLTSTLVNVVDPVVQLVSNIYRTLFLTQLVSLTINAQNDQFSGGDEPTDWETKPVSGITDGQYDVAAVRIGVAELLPNGVVLYLGRGSVGPVCSQTEVAAGGCTGY